MSEERDILTVPARLLAAAGVALHGPSWQTHLARSLQINIRTPQRWAAAARDDQPYQISRSLLAALLGELERKFRPLESCFDQLKAFHDDGV